MNMESVLNRLRDTVSATVYQVTSNVSTALPGNPLTRQYELIRQVGSAGPGLVFKIYEAVKKSTQEDAALFILEKKALEKLSKKDKEVLLEAIRRGVAQLTRLRHPSMLTVQHNLEESRDLIAFATEPVVGSLSNLFDANKNLDTDDSKDSQERSFYDVEIKYGLFSIAEGLVFLHKDAKILHRNISPENIIINRNGLWKISGFDFSVTTTTPNEQPYKYPALKVLPDTSLDAQPNFSYVALENLRDNSLVDASSDIFSLGILTLTLYNQGSAPCTFTSSHQYNPSKFAAELEGKLSSNNCWSSIPEESRKHIKLLCSIDTTLRPDAQQISKLQIFQDVLVRALQYFDSLFQWDNAQKAQFYKSFPDLLDKFPKRVRLRGIMSGLAKEFVNPEMVPFVLPNVLQIAKDTTDEEFHTWIVPHLVPVFKYKEPIQIGIYLLQNMEFLVKKFNTKPESLREHIIPLLYRFLESDAYQIQELCLSVVPTVIHLIDYSGTKNSLLPRIKKLALNTKLLSVRVNCLVCLGKILEHLDKWLVLDEVLTLVMQMPSREPAVIMASVGIFKLVLNSSKLGMTKEILATKVIPFLVPMSIENGLNLQQFNTVMMLIREMLSKVEEDHQTKLQQLDSIKVQHDSFFTSSESNKPATSGANFDPFNFNSVSAALPPQNLSNGSASGVLSLGDKERLAFQKEQQQRLNSEQPLIPQTNSSLSNKNSSNQAKDLTSTLISANLNMLPKSSSSSGFTSNISSTGFANFNTQPISHQGSTQLTNNSISSNSKPNMSSLDSLVILNSGQSRITGQSLNAMKSTVGAPSISSFANNVSTNHQSSQSSKQLSKSELEEFLN
ncbi:PREDICTED: SCY1-like protein 2 [Rhagoletis zephyria]|uniref:SCY1-like protein 2 n=1 Tax=Rhagoletis zephyria TaxID=28612 RepID=UPI00081177B2|nr:PREDICTED: SCY1-like protein 2 [Rhagoletis zephyria]